MELFYPAEMTFPQRVKNALVPVVWYYYRQWFFYPRLEELTREKLRISDMPKFNEIERNNSLIFTNTQYGEEYARSLPPNVIAVGGIGYIDKRKALPKDLEEFLKKGDGFIYMSFGSQADFLQMEESQQQVFIGAMKALPKMQFVWKVDNLEFVKEFPAKNVYISKWMPQQDILAHPKIRAFITHSGLLGIQEAIYNSVPLISFPVFAEQDYNAERIHRKEYGIRFEVTTVTQSELVHAINKVLTDPKYRNNMKRISMLFKERPQKPLDTALWWTDFVLRHSHEDLTALRPLDVGQAWWKRRQLDVWVTIMLSTLALLVSLVYLIYKLLKCMCGAKTSKTANDKNRKKKLK
jgi:UDP:flavonoid glycosyltransferase YjiC (YdhE family)